MDYSNIEDVMRALLWIALSFLLALPVFAEEGPDRSTTGGAQTLEDIMARQRGEKVDDSFRRDATGMGNVEALIGQLGTRGVASDAEVFRALRYGSATTSTSATGPTASMLIQTSGMQWQTFRENVLIRYGGYFLGGIVLAILGFYLFRGKIMIEGPKTGRNIIRFDAFERFAHWLLGVSFILLGITGLFLIAGRAWMIDLFGKEAFANIALAGKWVHNNVAWAFMLGLVLVFILWVKHNIPDRTDLTWMAKAGGLFTKGVHPPAKKFNAGQKIVFWSVFLFGLMISATGLALVFPFHIFLFEPIFEVLNAIGLPHLFIGGPAPVPLTPYQETIYAQAWHAIIAFAFMAIIIAHIYLGSVGMEGAIETMGTGEVDEQWAKEHHSLWYEEEMAKAKEAAPDQATPAE